jgi:hypothetical protein
MLSRLLNKSKPISDEEDPPMPQEPPPFELQGESEEDDIRIQADLSGSQSMQPDIPTVVETKPTPQEIEPPSGGRTAVGKVEGRPEPGDLLDVGTHIHGITDPELRALENGHRLDLDVRSQRRSDNRSNPSMNQGISERAQAKGQFSPRAIWIEEDEAMPQIENSTWDEEESLGEHASASTDVLGQQRPENHGSDSQVQPGFREFSNQGGREPEIRSIFRNPGSQSDPPGINPESKLDLQPGTSTQEGNHSTSKTQ